MNTGVSGVITKSKGVFFLDYTLKCVRKETQSFLFLFNTLICLEATLDLIINKRTKRWETESKVHGGL